MIYLCLGRREMGKTTLAAYLVRESNPRVLFDPRGLYPAVRRATTVQEIQQAFDEAEIREGQIEIVITPDSQCQACFAWTCKEVKAWLQQDRAVAFVIDEMRFVDTDIEELDWILRCATRESVRVVFTGHRPSDVPTDIRAITDYWLLFQATQEHDLKVIRERCTESVASTVERLAPRHFVAWDDARAQSTVYRYPDRWYVPLGRPAPIRRESNGLPAGEKAVDPGLDFG